jgi:hypothetical protein
MQSQRQYPPKGIALLRGLITSFLVGPPEDTFIMSGISPKRCSLDHQPISIGLISIGLISIAQLPCSSIFGSDDTNGF